MAGRERGRRASGPASSIRSCAQSRPEAGAEESACLRAEGSRPGPRGARDGGEDIARAAAKLPRKAENLPAIDLELDRLHETVRPEIVGREEDFSAPGPAALGKHVLELASEHQLDKRVDVEVARASGRLAYAVPHDGDAIAELEDLIEAVADIDDRLAALREASDHLQNPFAIRLS